VSPPFGSTDGEGKVGRNEGPLRNEEKGECVGVISFVLYFGGIWDGFSATWKHACTVV